jgi:hypothetical protein
MHSPRQETDSVKCHVPQRGRHTADTADKQEAEAWAEAVAGDDDPLDPRRHDVRYDRRPASGLGGIPAETEPALWQFARGTDPQWDPELAAVAAHYGAALVCTHAGGVEPRTHRRRRAAHPPAPNDL